MKQGNLHLSKPKNGLVTLTVGDTDIASVTHANPFLLEDLADFVDDVCDREHSVSLRLDSQDLGMVYLTVMEADTITVTCDGRIAKTCSGHDLPEDVECLADSIEANRGAWCEWSDACDENSVDDVVRRMRLAARRLRSTYENPDKTMRLWLGLEPHELTEEDGELLVARMRAMVARTRTLAQTVVQARWHVDEDMTCVEADEDGHLRTASVYVKLHYGSPRQLALVRRDGCVEYGGWCDRKNMVPVREAFRAWCRDVRKLHRTTNEDKLARRRDF
jgi:hypothetical protein